MTAIVPSSDIGIANSTLSVDDSEPEEQPAHQRGEQHREPELEADLVDRLLDEAGGVEQHLDVHARRQGLLDVGDRGAHRVGDRDRVGARLLEDAHRLDRRAVGPRHAGDVDEAVLDQRDVAEPDLRRAELLDHDVAQGLEVGGLAEHADVDRALAVGQLAARRRDVLLLQRLCDVGRPSCWSRPACRRRPRSGPRGRGSPSSGPGRRRRASAARPAAGSARRRRAAGARTAPTRRR